MRQNKVSGSLRKGKRVVFVLLILAIACAVCFAAGFFFSTHKSGKEITSDTIFQQVQEISSISTLEYNYTNMGKFKDSASLKGWTIPLTEKSFILTYDGKIKAGIDMEKLDIEVSGQTITVKLPSAEILSHEVDENSIEIYDETKNIFNPISVSDYAAFSTQQKEVMEKKAIKGGLLEAAQTRAEKTIKQLLTGNSGVAKEYTVKFKKADNIHETKAVSPKESDEK